MKVNKILLLIVVFFSLSAPSALAGTFTSYSQDVTAYTASQIKPDKKLRYTHSGELPQSGYVAVRKNSSNQPHVPFGSSVITPQKVIVDGTSFGSFSVQDTGVSSSQTYYAIDIWWGFCRTSAYGGSGATVLGCSTSDSKYVSAKNFGEKSWTLQYFTP